MRSTPTAATSPADVPRIGYVLKRYPRLSETFIVTEILAHEAAGMELEIFSLRNPTEGRFHAELARVRAPVTYLARERIRAIELWDALATAARSFPRFKELIGEPPDASVNEFLQAIELATAVNERGIDHLHAHFATSATTVARLAAALAGVPYSFTAHAKDIFHEDVADEDLRRKLRDAAFVVTVSRFNAAHLAERFGPDAARVRTIYNGLDLRCFPFTAPADGPPVILGVGRLVEKKGFVDLVEACAILAERGAEFRCRIIGAGDLEEALSERIRARGLADRVEMLGPRPRDEVVAEIRRASVLAAPCIIGSDGNRDGLPTVLLEAMALGTPCISTDVTGIPEAIEDGCTGLLTPQHDPHALADRIARVLDDRALARALATNARRLVERTFDIERNTADQRGLFGCSCDTSRGDGTDERRAAFAAEGA
jgi:glycosyltransferase involved in cell wall biosynthesis